MLNLRVPIRTAAILGVLTAIVATATQVSAAEVKSLVDLQFPNDPESIAIDHSGNIFVSAPLANKVLLVRRGGSQASTFATLPANVLGVRLDEEGNLFAAVLGAGIFEVREGTMTPVRVAAPPAGSPEFFWNGMAFDHEGNLFVSESHFGEIWRLSGDGSFTKWFAAPDLVGTVQPGPCGLVHPAVGAGFGAIGANGIFFNKHGDMLVNNTDLGTVVRIRVKEDGSAGGETVFAGPSCDLWGADGGAFDNRDNLYVAANSGNKIIKVDPAGHFQVFSGSSLLHFPTDIAFGTGRGDRTVAFITNLALTSGFAGGGIVTVDIGTPGRPL